MSDPTIPELVARLRELRARAPYKDLSVSRIESELGKTAFYVPNVYEADDLRVWDLADLITETLNALPTLLDALERGQEGDNPGVSYLRTVANNLRLRGGTITFTARQLETVLAGLGAHSPDGGKVEGDLRHYRQLVDALQRAGQAADLVCGTPIEDVPGLLLQRSTWRPISEPPSAEVHAWCGGRYMFEADDGRGFVMTVNFDADELAEFFGAMTCKHYLPIPPSDERRG